MPEVRPIDANAFIADLKDEAVNLYLNGLKGTPRDYKFLYDIADRVGEQPTLTDYAPIVKAHWVYTPCDGALVTFCSHCGYEETGENLQKYKGCPMCRAMMTHTNRVF